MSDDMFSFIDPIVELNDEGTGFVIQAELFFDFLEKSGIEKPDGLPEGEIPLAVAVSLLKPDELEKLKKYVMFYLAKHGNG